MKKYIALLGLSSLPLLASAQITDLTSFQTTLQSILAIVFPILLTIAVFVIVWGIFKFILNAGDEEARKTGRSFILWGVVGIFLMLSVWGLVNILYNTIPLDTTPITPPAV
ncbi:MAG: hypothetical protein A3C06_02315 [Candidatus Taylorbacteria bacterium RIFCSPHIGHO2_02_FULL_46_13]|uniref:DUF4190 domain-containing protein n=1 Tax=Candidatus Taylorbacteria bacterium RIFCSPHIGHO2_02_FULL_46_13 TaxID=1802312 RepID=A0A1G2MSZ1_9BACT|nr:MAG: hypothetical protein A3C06_02315 [Candidatus Taylorbacteria bacterium RIFCSPHIGHO2_02_FULL_46_13]